MQHQLDFNFDFEAIYLVRKVVYVRKKLYLCKILDINLCMFQHAMCNHIPSVCVCGASVYSLRHVYLYIGF